MAASTPQDGAAYGEGCINSADDPDVSGAWGLTTNKFKFHQNVGIGPRAVPDDKRFKPVVDDQSLDELLVQSFSVNTDRKVQWVCEMYRDWWFRCVSQVQCDSRIKWANLEDCKSGSKSNFCYALCHFVTEIRRKDGKEFLGKTLHEIVICLQFFLQKSGIEWKLLDDPEFVKLKHTLDNVMKQHAEMGVGQRTKAQSISLGQEDVMWAKGILGEANPVQLRDTIQYLLGVNLVLRGGRNTSNYGSWDMTRRSRS